jgi:hypothetical protein
MKKEILEGVHYYLESGKVVFTEVYHSERGVCCGNRCRHCPYSPKHVKGTTEKKDFSDHKD